MSEAMAFSRMEFVERLVKDLGYGREDAEYVWTRLGEADPRLRAAAAKWWSTGEWCVPDIEGFSFVGLQEDQGLAPFGALLALDWLVREPTEARLALRRPRHRLVGRSSEGD